jgi:hypothetical protein
LQATAIECINYLKAQKCAPETFVPLDTIRAKPAAERLRTLGGTKRPVIDVISVSEKFVRAVQYAVGDTVVCDTLTEARQLAYHSGDERYKVGSRMLTAVASFARCSYVCGQRNLLPPSSFYIVHAPVLLPSIACAARDGPAEGAGTHPLTSPSLSLKGGDSLPLLSPLSSLSRW